MIDGLRVFKGGHCRQWLALVDRRTWRLEQFPARFLALHHVSLGWILVDTGYGSEFVTRTRGWPYRLYRMATPVTQAGRSSDLLNRAAISTNSVRHIIITHFHGDHVGGLQEFPHAEHHYCEEALTKLLRLKPMKQVCAAFVPSLLPDWFGRQAHPVALSEFKTSTDVPFPTHDLFGDGSLRMVSLPGHAPGHVGVLFSLNGKRILYASDAFWRWCQIDEEIRPSRLALSIQWEANLYEATVVKLRSLYREGNLRLASCHDTTCLEDLETR